MTKRLISLVFLLMAVGLGGVLNAQEKGSNSIEEVKPKKLRLGVKAAVGIDWGQIEIDGDPDPLTLPNFGYKLGVVAEYSVFRSWFLESGVYYSTRAIQGDINGKENDFEMNMQTVQIPLLVTYKVSLGKKSKFYSQLGGFFNYAYAGTETIYEITSKPDAENPLTPTVIEEINQDIDFGIQKGQTRPDDWGVSLGLGLEYEHFKVGLFYDMGTSDYNTYDPKYKARSGGASFTYLF